MIVRYLMILNRKMQFGIQGMKEDPAGRLGEDIWASHHIVRMFMKIMRDCFMDYVHSQDFSRWAALYALYQQLEGTDQEFTYLVRLPERHVLPAGTNAGTDFIDNNLADGRMERLARDFHDCVERYTLGNPRVMHFANIRINQILQRVNPQGIHYPLLNPQSTFVAAQLQQRPPQLPAVAPLNPAHIDVDQEWNKGLEPFAPFALATGPLDRRLSKKHFAYLTPMQDPTNPANKLPFKTVTMDTPIYQVRCCGMKIVKNKPTKRRCDNWEDVGLEYCWWHLQFVFNLIIRPTRQRDPTEFNHPVLKRLGLFCHVERDKPHLENVHETTPHGNVTYQQWVTHVTDQRVNQPVFARGEFIVYLNGIYMDDQQM